MKERLSEAVKELQKCMDDNAELRLENSEFQEEIECLQSQLSSQCDISEVFVLAAQSISQTFSLVFTHWMKANN